MKEQTPSPETLQEAAEGCIIIPMADFLAIISVTKGEIERYTEQEKNPNAPLLNNVKRATYFKEVYTKVLGMTEKLFKSFESKQPQQGVRWVRASERLPKNGLVHYKSGGLNDVVFYSDINGFFRPKFKNTNGVRETIINKITTPLDRIEWLDETPTPEPKEQIK